MNPAPTAQLAVPAAPPPPSISEVQHQIVPGPYQGPSSARAVQNFANGASVTDGGVSTTGTSGGKSGKMGLMAVAAIALLALGGGAAFLVMKPKPADPPPTSAAQVTPSATPDKPAPSANAQADAPSAKPDAPKPPEAVASATAPVAPPPPPATEPAKNHAAGAGSGKGQAKPPGGATTAAPTQTPKSPSQNVDPLKPPDSIFK
jgi:serine/threonine-protein kinase